MIYDELRPKFWENYPLDALTDAEWEALCDGCGACCLVKFLDDDNVKFIPMLPASYWTAQQDFAKTMPSVKRLCQIVFA